MPNERNVQDMCVELVFGPVSVEGDGAAGTAPVRSFSKISPGSNLSPSLAKTEPISTFANKYLSGETGLAMAFVLRVLLFGWGRTEGHSG